MIVRLQRHEQSIDDDSQHDQVVKQGVLCKAGNILVKSDITSPEEGAQYIALCRKANTVGYRPGSDNAFGLFDIAYC